MQTKEYSIEKDITFKDVDLIQLHKELEAGINKFYRLIRIGDSLKVVFHSEITDFTETDNIVKDHVPKKDQFTLPNYSDSMSLQLSDRSIKKSVYTKLSSFYYFKDRTISGLMVNLIIDDKISDFDLRLINIDTGKILVEQKGINKNSSGIYIFTTVDHIDENGQLDLEVLRRTGSANSIIGQELRVFYN